MHVRSGIVALLLLGSGFSALIYQAVWLRQFRLIFGASTLASAAVLAVFMGGLGFGAWWIGRKADRSLNPLAFYAWLEIGVAVSAAATPLLLWAVRSGYLAIGGSFLFGPFLATVVRLLLTAVVLGVPTIFMGGTLPAAARAVEKRGDAGRSGVSLIYGCNALGAVTGVLFSTFFLLERFGNLKSLIAAALFNALVGMAALAYSNRLRRPVGKSRQLQNELSGPEEETTEDAIGPSAPPRFVYAAAAAVGFAFFLMELVWYRMLTPILGGTTYTFGLILGVALAGIGAGSFAWSLRTRRATLAAFAISCALEALLLAIPFALGDRLAFVALLTRSLGAIGFSGYVLSWTAVTFVVVFPAAFVAGLQFPLLISLLGEGRDAVARHVGSAYLWNTAGAIAGSVAGGFGLLPLLTAPGAWRAVVILLAAVSAMSLFVTSADRRRASGALTSLVAAVCAIALLFAEGPTAFWRHTPIGAGRADMVRPVRNRLIDLQHTRQRTTAWEAEGIESSVSLAYSDGYAFIVNGKSDGHARFDAGTQVMGGVLPAMLHPNAKTAVVIGLGTGTTAGWLGALPSIEHVDVVEIEPSIVRIAEVSAPVNRDVLRNPKVEVIMGDGREFLLAKGAKYDIISSEPSNPYRSGIANLFTTEFYEACAERLNRGGIFAQFLQAYEVDAETIATIYSTISGVFPSVETWQTAAGDLLLVASLEPIRHDWTAIERKMQDPIVQAAVRNAWGVSSTAGFYARYVAGNETATRLAAQSQPNTDDRPFVEYAFARTLGFGGAFDVAELRSFARTRIDDVPAAIRDVPQAAAIEAARLSIGVAHEARIDIHQLLTPELRNRGAAQLRYLEGGLADTWVIWKGQTVPPGTPLEMITFAGTLAERGDSEALRFIEALRSQFPIEADALLARLRWRQGQRAEATSLLVSVFERYRTNPWPLPIVMRRALRLADEIGESGELALVQRLEPALREPFSIEMFRELRRSILLALQDRAGAGGPCSDLMLETLRSYEPHVPWQEPFLQKRATCYEQRGEPLASEAAADLREFRSAARTPLDAPPE